MEYWTILLSIVIGVLGIRHLFKTFHYFKRHNVIYMPPTPIFRIMMQLFFRRTSFNDWMQKVYNFKPDAKYYGMYTMTQPIVFLRDPELIKETLVKNFDFFPDRRGFSGINDPLFSKNLFSLQGQKWKDVRTLLSPAFTSSKMKTMFILMSECAVNFAKFLSTVPSDKRDMDMKDVFTKYTTDVIATCAFGNKADSMNDPTNKFYVYGRYISNIQGLRGLKFVFFMNFPRLAKFFNMKFLSEDVTTFFKDVVKTTIETRDAKNITRPDMIQLMMDIRGKREAERELSIEDMTAQAFVFFLGGFETTSTTMSFIALLLAAHPDIQANLRQEIDNALENSKGEVTYETINRLQYLDAVINETLRIYPPLFVLERLCVKDYELPPALPNEKPFVLKKGIPVLVPIYSLHRDEKYYDNPEQFRPDRFLNNNAHHNSPCYIPFGLGPRMCIANRFALLEVKIVLFHLLARCELKPCAKTVLPIKLSNIPNFSIQPEGGFWLNVEHRNDMHPTIRSTTLG